jgi:hypothetical protein
MTIAPGLTKKTIKLNVTGEEAQIIVNALFSQPFGTVYQLVLKLDQQIKASTPAANLQLQQAKKGPTDGNRRTG